MFQVETKAKQPPPHTPAGCITFFCTLQSLLVLFGLGSNDLVAHCHVMPVQLSSVLKLLIAFPPAGRMLGEGSPGSQGLTWLGSNLAQSRCCGPICNLSGLR